MGAEIVLILKTPIHELVSACGPRGGKRDGIVQTAAKSMARDLGRQLLRGVLGSLSGGRKR